MKTLYNYFNSKEEYIDFHLFERLYYSQVDNKLQIFINHVSINYFKGFSKENEYLRIQFTIDYIRKDFRLNITKLYVTETNVKFLRKLIKDDLTKNIKNCKYNLYLINNKKNPYDDCNEKVLNIYKKEKEKELDNYVNKLQNLTKGKRWNLH